MKEFEFIVDRKISLWIRTKIYVEGENQKDAKEKLLKELNKNNDSIYDYMNNGDEYLYETEEIIKPEKNDNQATFEVFENETIALKNRIYSNAKKSEM